MTSLEPAPRPDPQPLATNAPGGPHPARLQAGHRAFHVRAEARTRYAVDEHLFELSGNVILPNLRAVRSLAAAMTAARRAAGQPEPVAPASLNAMGLIDEILHAVVAIYREQEDPEAIDDALDHLDDALGTEEVDATLLWFAQSFPPLVVYRGQEDAATYLGGETDGVPNREIALEELANCWLANANGAFVPFRELFDDADLVALTRYRDVVAELARFFTARPRFGPDHQDLVTMLRAPAVAEPTSLGGQLRWIRARWGAFLSAYLGDRFGALLDRIVTGLDVVAEDERATWMRFHAGPGGGGGEAPGFGAIEEPERFSEDKDWMPRAVLMAKSTYVWLDQLSKWYGREIRTLDAIPDEELDRLARWGFTGLWLIGLWERSRASREIKVRRGNPDAVASAYSLRDYAIAEDIGGEAAYANLRDRAWRRGLRLASDMVPNHMGIDSRWVVEHPGWFLSRSDAPYPAYSFNGPDLSDDDRVGIFLEDHYWDATDAAVVFRRVDRWSGDTRFVYHGNDGTSMPWNDTAQLDYLNPEVREAVIQTIIAVARRFPIIRFDAAMTLAKRHIARLWYPEPGAGGAIPSRSESAMSKDAFEAAIPVEFWREVVDRVAAEVPDTLLLAEAFWMMEGYFVRTLGMHRVYNSAFMHMLRDEKNAEYRVVVKDTLAFDPEILKRYVNFMNNPDEKTAVEQFGTGDKYFGIATVLSTMPGLPMFGHGQIEGFAEKYGMEFRRAYWDERPNEALVGRHEWQVFPLLHRRRLFAEVRDFRFYDVEDDAGFINEDVFAYSNRSGGDRALIVYHNRFGSMRGTIRTSVPFSEKDAEGEKSLVSGSLADGLGLDGGEAVVVYRDALAGLDYIREATDLRANGFRVELDAYATHVYLDWRVVTGDAMAEYRALAAELGGNGVPSVERALAERRLRPLHDAAAILLNEGFIREVVDAVAATLGVRARVGLAGGGVPAGPAAGTAGGEAGAAGVESAGAAAEADVPGGGAAAAAGLPDLDRLADDAGARCRDALFALRAVRGRAVGDDAVGEAVAQFTGALRSALELATAGPDKDGSPAAATAAANGEESARGAGERAAAARGAEDAAGERAAAARGSEDADESAAARGSEDADESAAARDAGATADATSAADPQPAADDATSAARAFVAAGLPPSTTAWAPLLGWLSAEAFAAVLAADPTEGGSSAWFDALGMGRVLVDACRWRGMDEGAAWWAVETVRNLLRRPGAGALAGPEDERAGRLVRAWFADEELGRWLGLNRHEGVAYVNRESFEAALRWLVIVVAVRPGTARAIELREAYELAVALTDAAAASGYQVGRIIAHAAP